MAFRKFLFLIILSINCTISLGAQDTAPSDSLLVRIEQSDDEFERVLYIINFVENTIGIKPKVTNAYRGTAISYFEEDVFPSKDFVETIWATLIHRSEGKFDLALKENLEVVDILEHYDTPSHFSQVLLSKMLGYLGQLYNRSHYYEPVLDYLFKALAIAEKEGYIEGQAMALNAMSVLYAEGFEDYELAIDYSQRVLALTKQMDNHYATMILTDNLATYYTKLRDWEKSLPLHLEAIRLAESLNRTPYLGDFYKNIGNNYLAQQNTEKAIEYAQKAISVQAESRNEYLPAYAYHLWGKGLQQKKQWAASISYFEKAIDLAKQSRDFRFISELLNDYAISATQNQQAGKANIYFKEAIAYKDSLYQAFKLKQVVELETRHRIQDVEKEKALLQQEKKLQEEIIHGQQRQLWLLGGLGLLAIISSLIFFFQKKQLRDSYQKLFQKNRDLVAIENATNTPSKAFSLDQDLKEKIEVALIQNQLYLQADITVHKLAKEIESNTTYVSKTINEGFGKNFSSLIKEYRIKAALKALESGAYEQYTIESLGNQSGFKSRSAFINAFKKYTGVTPSFYIKQLKNQ